MGIVKLPYFITRIAKYAQAEILRVLQLFTEKDNYPILVHCTQGKDRTGLIMALILSALGVPRNEIIEDFYKSDIFEGSEKFRQEAREAMIKNKILNEDFLRAPREVMEEVLEFIDKTYGSIENYLNKIGFHEEYRKKLREIMLEEPSYD